jgi:hypothetical protein
VNAVDLAQERIRLSNGGADPRDGGDFGAYHDLDGDWQITVRDLLLCRRNLFRRLPPAGATPTAFLIAPPPPGDGDGATATQLFGLTPIL